MSETLLYRDAARTMAAGSRSFGAASRLMDARTRESTVLLYAWCRYCDDVVDGQTLGHGQRFGRRIGGAQRLQRLQEMTHDACAGRPAADPVFEGLAQVVRRHAIPPALLQEHLAGFGMDVQGLQYRELEDVLPYCWRVAGVVGVMMARVMGVERAETLDRACDLGIAFQLTNIARDVLEDAAIGRLYLPAAWLEEEGVFGVPDVLDPLNRVRVARVATRLVQAAEPYYASARAGIADLPLRSAWAIATARGIYREIGQKVMRSGGQAWDERAGTTSMEKLWFVLRGAALALALPYRAEAPRPVQLFTRPA